MKKISSLILTVMSVVLVVACNKKSDGGGSAAPAVATCTPGQVMPNGYYCNNGIQTPYNTVGGQQGFGNLAQLYMQNSYFQGEVYLAGTMVANQGGMIGTPSPDTYSGQVQLQGTVQVLNQSLCGAPPGGYSFTGTGMMSAGTVYNAQVVMSGPVQMQLMIGTAYIYQTNRFGIFSSQLTVNGQPCGNITTY